MDTTPLISRSTAHRLLRLRRLSVLAAVGLAACGGGGDDGSATSTTVAAAPAVSGPAPAPGPVTAPPPPATTATPSPPPPAPPPPAPPPSAPPPPAPATLTAPTQIATVATGLDHPWGLAFLPDGRLLVTERAGRLRVVATNGTLTTVTGLPAVEAVGQGGLLDVALDPSHSSNRRVYWSYAEASGSTNGLAVARGELNLTSSPPSLTNVTVIYRQSPKVSGSSGHYGGRIVFGNDGKLFVMMGDRQIGSQQGYAQDLSRGNGKVARINTDGSVPADNPFVATAGAQPAIWSRGHRNPQGAAIHPTTGALWSVEHGPQGGDELNTVRSGLNYGWPLISYGCEYGSTPADTCTTVGGATAMAGLEQPVTTWVPYSTAPSGLMFYTGTRFTAWTGKAFAGALSGETLWQFDIDRPGAVVCTPRTGQTRTNCSEVALVKSQSRRIRDVRQAPDGTVYLLTDDGNTADRILRLQ